MKQITCFVLLAAAVLALSGCGAGQTDLIWRPYAEEITAIHMRNGSTGELAVITEPEQIEALLDLIGGRPMSRSRDQRLRMGYLFSLQFYRGDKKKDRLLVGGERINVNGTYYDLGEAISPQSLQELFSSFPITRE